MEDNDFLHGAAKIAEFFYGDPTKTRQVYHLAESGDLPIIKVAGRLIARKSALTRAIEERERKAVDLIGRQNSGA